MIDAFILTSHLACYDEGQTISFWAISDQGPLLLKYKGEKSIFFIEHDADFSHPLIQRKALNLKTFSDKQVDGLYFKNDRELLSIKDKLTSEGIRTYESDIRTPERFLMERFINGALSILPGGQVEQGLYKTFFNPQIRPSSFRPNIKFLSFDIETGRNEALFSIAFHQTDLKGTEEKKLVCMIGDLDDTEEVLFFPNETELLLKTLEVFRTWDPDCIIGWHVIGFDMTFLQKKYHELGIDFSIGRGGSKLALYTRGGKTFADLPGRVIIDGIVALRNAFYRFEDFKLETVAQEVLGRGKDIAGDNKVSEIERRFREDKLSLAHYNLLDCMLVTEIFRKMNIIDLLLMRTQISGLLIDKMGLSVAAFDHFFLPHLHRKGFVAGNMTDMHKTEESPGGCVFEPIVGLHENVMALDFKSLYPTIMTTFCIDPYSRMMASKEETQMDNVLHTPAGVSFSRLHHILPKHIEELMNVRRQAQKEGDESLSKAIKILMNSFYGVMGHSNCRFYHVDLPTAIAETGRWILKESRNFLESRGYEVLYGDTDSLFVKLKYGDRKNIFERGPIVAQEINENLKDILWEKFQVDSRCTIEFEDYYKKIFFPPTRGGHTGAKKKYVGLKEASSGKTQWHFSGMEFVRGDWTKLAKNFQQEIFKKLFNGEEAQEIIDWIKSYVSQLRKGDFDSDVIYKKKISKNLNEYTKNIPPHIQAAKMIKRKDTDFRLREVSYVYTKKGPVPVQLHPIDINYEHYIDKQIAPLANGVLFVFKRNFNDVIQGNQLSLF